MAKTKKNLPVNWQKVEAPVPWYPEPGEVLEGIYVGPIVKTNFTTKDTYVIHVIRTETECFSVSGTVICQLFDTGKVPSGSLVKVIFQGNKETSNGFTMKKFELFVATA